MRCLWMLPLMLGLVGGAMAAPRAKVRPAATSAAVVAAPPGDPVAGREKAESERCIECHGEAGQGAGHSNGPEGKFAKLAGQSAAYIVKQIEDFRSGARKHDVMAVMARSIEDADLRDIAAYFAAQAPMQGAGPVDGGLAERLVAQGNAARGIPACSACHGGATQAPATALHPRLAGQEYRYLAQQLHDWRSGWRRNSPGGVMSAVTAKLTDAEIEALSLYWAGLR